MASLVMLRRSEHPASLPEVHGTIATSRSGNPLRRLLSFVGPGYLVAVGYMDPGNWATDLAGGSAFGYTLLSVILISNLMAILLQSLAARLGIATGRDLAQACRAHYSRPVNLALWVLCEVAIIACDLAEVIGTAIALQLLFGIPLVLGRVAHRAGRDADPAAAAARFPLSRGVHHQPDHGDRGLLRDRDGHRPARLGRGRHGLRAQRRDHRQPSHALHRHRHPRRHGDAA